MNFTVGFTLVRLQSSHLFSPACLVVLSENAAKDSRASRQYELSIVITVCLACLGSCQCLNGDFTHTHKHTHVIKEFFLNSTSFSLGQSRYYLGRQTTFEAFFLPRKNFLALTAEMVRYICSTCLCKEQEFFRQLHNNASLYSFTTSK